MQICRELAGFSYGQADLVRRAMRDVYKRQVYMNAGAYGGEIKDVLACATFLDETGAERTLQAGELQLKPVFPTGTRKSRRPCTTPCSVPVPVMRPFSGPVSYTHLKESWHAPE